MTDLWSLPDFDGHEAVTHVSDPASGLRAIIAIHSTHLGPAAAVAASGIMPRPRTR
jgi:leucine dehydrogenase